MTKTCLMVLTSTAELGDTGKPTGFFWEELATPYWAFRDAGYAVTIASIRGGRPPADPGSDSADARPADVQRFMDDPEAMAALSETPAVSGLDGRGFDAIFLPGGHGTMWDFRQSEALGRVLAEGHEAGAVVGAVCHGPAGLLGAVLPDDTPLLKGRRVNGFSNAEEEMAGLTEVVPFLLEDALAGLGAYEKAAPFAAHAVRDGRVVTGQNPASSARTAELMLEALDEAGRDAA